MGPWRLPADWEAPIYPVVHLGPIALPSYAIAVLVAFAVSGFVRAREVRRLGYDRNPAHAWVGLGGLLGAMLGAKLGLVLFEPWSELQQVLAGVFSLDFTGKTVLGGLTGGYLGVEAMKKLVGVTHSTGDGFALALPIGQAIGRLGCFFNGCCFGEPTSVPWAVHLHEAWRHPSPLYEAGGDLLLAALVWSWRSKAWPQGNLFKRYLIGYALLRASLEPWRGDAQLWWGPLTAVQWYCLLVAVGFGLVIWRSERARPG